MLLPERELEIMVVLHAMPNLCNVWSSSSGVFINILRDVFVVSPYDRHVSKHDSSARLSRMAYLNGGVHVLELHGTPLAVGKVTFIKLAEGTIDFPV